MKPPRLILASLYVLLLILISIPPIALLYQSLENPSFSIAASYEPYNKSHVVLSIEISYNGSFSLDNFKIAMKIANKTYTKELDVLKPGSSVTLSVLVPRNIVYKAAPSQINISFTIGVIEVSLKLEKSRANLRDS